MPTNYQRGRAKEHHAIAQLKKQGYATIRAAGSKGAYDLLAWKDGEPCRCIQVKREDKACNSTYPAERRQLAQAPCPIGGRRELWVWADDLKAWRAQMLIISPDDFQFLLQVPIKRKPLGRRPKSMPNRRTPI